MPISLKPRQHRDAVPGPIQQRLHGEGLPVGPLGISRVFQGDRQRAVRLAGQRHGDARRRLQILCRRQQRRVPARISAGHGPGTGHHGEVAVLVARVPAVRRQQGWEVEVKGVDPAARRDPVAVGPGAHPGEAVLTADLQGVDGCGGLGGEKILCCGGLDLGQLIQQLLHGLAVKEVLPGDGFAVVDVERQGAGVGGGALQQRVAAAAAACQK